MIHSAEVFLWGTRIGIVYQGENDTIVDFEYDRHFIDSGIELSPFQMPLSERVYRFPELGQLQAFHGLPGLLADSLPDRFGNAVINKWLVDRGRSPESFTAIERLCYTGSRGMGALEYVPANGPESRNTDIDVTEMVRLASEILQGKEYMTLAEDRMNKMQLLEIGSSAGGARAKAVIAWNEKTGEIKSGQIDTDSDFMYWLMKFDGVAGNGDHEVADGRQYTRIEYAYYLMAKDIGIDMSECRIFEKDGFAHFMTKRFDRINGDKIHMQTLAALGHFDYNIPNLCSYEMLAGYARRLGIGKSGIEQIFIRMVFAVAGVNCDDHVKNFSFLMSRNGKWNISPAYDLCFAYKPDNRWISSHQMSVNGKTRELTEQDLIESGLSMGLSKAGCKQMIAKTKEVVSQWLLYAEKSGIREKRAVEIEQEIKENGITHRM